MTHYIEDLSNVKHKNAFLVLIFVWHFKHHFWTMPWHVIRRVRVQIFTISRRKYHFFLPKMRLESGVYFCNFPLCRSLFKFCKTSKPSATLACHSAAFSPSCAINKYYTPHMIRATVSSMVLLFSNLFIFLTFFSLIEH